METSTPNAIDPIYPNGPLGSDVELYSGTIRLIRDDSTFEGQGRVFLSWKSVGRIRFQLSLAEPGEIDFVQEFRIEFSSGQLIGGSHHVTITYVGGNLEGGQTIKGAISGVKFSEEIETCRARIQFANLPFNGSVVKTGCGQTFNGRLSVEIGSWFVAIYRSLESTGFAQELEKSGGFALTHTCEVKRLDGKQFSLEQLAELGEKLRLALSFCCGRWVGPLFFAGLDGDDNVVSQLWKSPKLSPASNRRNFLDSIDSSVTSILQRFCQKLDCPTWAESLDTAVYWYLVAADTNSAENWTVACQIAFELLGWVYLVNEKRALCCLLYTSPSPRD